MCGSKDKWWTGGRDKLLTGVRSSLVRASVADVYDLICSFGLLWLVLSATHPTGLTVEPRVTGIIYHRLIGRAPAGSQKR